MVETTSSPNLSASCEGGSCRAIQGTLLCTLAILDSLVNIAPNSSALTFQIKTVCHENQFLASLATDNNGPVSRHCLSN